MFYILFYSGETVFFSGIDDDDDDGDGDDDDDIGEGGGSDAGGGSSLLSFPQSRLLQICLQLCPSK